MLLLPGIRLCVCEGWMCSKRMICLFVSHITHIHSFSHSLSLTHTHSHTYHSLRRPLSRCGWFRVRWGVGWRGGPVTHVGASTVGDVTSVSVYVCEMYCEVYVCVCKYMRV
jgi:hypothetical protein